MSSVVGPFESPFTRLGDGDCQVTRLPSPERRGKLQPLPAWAPELWTEAMVVVLNVGPGRRSRMKMSFAGPSSAGSMFVASEMNATIRPSAEMDGAMDGPSGLGAVTLEGWATEMRTVVFAPGTVRSRMKTSVTAPLRSGPNTLTSGIRFVATDWNAMRSPLAEIDGAVESPFPFAPPN